MSLQLSKMSLHRQNDVDTMVKDKRFQIRISEEDLNELSRIAAEVDRPVAQLIRDGVRKEISELKRRHPRLKEVAAVELARI